MSTILDILHAPLSEAKQEYRFLMKSTESITEDAMQIRSLSSWGSDWQGRAAQAAGHRLDSRTNRILIQSHTMHMAALVMNSHAHILHIGKALLKMLLIQMRTMGVSISSEGTLSPPALAWLYEPPIGSILTLVQGSALAGSQALQAFLDSQAFSTPVDTLSEDMPRAMPEGVSPGAKELHYQALHYGEPSDSGLNYLPPSEYSESTTAAVQAAQRTLKARGIEAPVHVLSSSSDPNSLILSIGDIHSASHITTHISGVGSSSPSSLARYAASGAQNYEPGKAIIMWHDYPAPPNLAAALSSTAATEGGKRLSDFQKKLRQETGSSSQAPFLEVVGHSYGSRVLGAAASGGRTLHADRVILNGSPGVGVKHRSQLSIDAQDGHAEVYSNHVPGDAIVATTTPWGGVHNRDPSSPSFGADNAPTWGGYWWNRYLDGYLLSRGERNSHSSYHEDPGALPPDPP